MTVSCQQEVKTSWLQGWDHFESNIAWIQTIAKSAWHMCFSMTSKLITMITTSVLQRRHNCLIGLFQVLIIATYGVLRRWDGVERKTHAQQKYREAQNFDEAVVRYVTSHNEWIFEFLGTAVHEDFHGCSIRPSRALETPWSTPWAWFSH